MLDPFEQRRSQVLQGLASPEVDKSRAGGVDARIQGLVNCMNQHRDVYTTSSCSGRISVFAEPSAETKAAGKKGGEWVYATHDLADGQDVLKCIQERMTAGSKLIFRFEPFILAAECRDMSSAQKLVAIARQAGFRESGVTATKARTIAGIRCSLRLEVPVAHEGRLLVDTAYLQKYLVDFGNEKMEANWVRTDRLHHLFEDQLLSRQDAPSNNAQQPHFKKQSRAGGSKQSGDASAPTHQKHISDFAMQQLLQAGVSDQLLHQLQTAPQTHLQTNPPAESQSTPQTAAQQESASFREPRHNMKPKRQARTEGGARSGSKVEAAQRACLLQARQEAILRRISMLEGDQAHNSDENGGSVACSGQLVWADVKPTMQGVEASTLNRWGHTTTLYGNKLVVFGGYGGTGAHSRTADVLVYDCSTNILSAPSIQGSCPPARMGHSAVLLGDSLVIFGGRMSPAQPLADVWKLDLLSHTWHCIACKGHPPVARYRHTAVAFGSQAKDGSMVVHGGYDGQNTFADTYVLSTSDWTWRQVMSTGHAPEPCHSHAATALQGRMFVFGGSRGYCQQACPGLYILDLKTQNWEAITLPQAAPQTSPLPCFSHSLTAVGGLLVLAGGCHTLGADHIHVYDPSHKQWSRHSVANSSCLVLCRHTATSLPHHRSIILLGGGMNCFGFGTTFSSPVLLDLTSLINQHTASQSTMPATSLASDGTASGQNPDSNLPTLPTNAAAAAAHQASDSTPPGQNPDRALRCGAVSDAKSVEPMHDAVTGAKATPTPSEGDRGGVLQGGAGRGGAKATASPSAQGPPVGDQSVQQNVMAACVRHEQGQAQLGAGKQGVVVARLQAKAAKDALKGLGWLDRSCRSGTDPSSGAVCLPVTDRGRAVLGSAAFSCAQNRSDPAKSSETGASQLGCAEQAAQADSAELSSAQTSSAQLNSASSAELGPAGVSSAAKTGLRDCSTVQSSSSCTGCSQPLLTGKLPVTDGSSGKLKGSTVGAKGKKRQAVGRQEADMACLQALMQAGLAVVQPMEMQRSGRGEGGPAQRLKGAVTPLLRQHGVGQERIAQLLLELPSRWEKLGDLALLPRTSMASPEWGCLGQPLWEAVACVLAVTRLAMQAPVADAGTRDSQAQLVLGTSGWVQHKEGGVLYCLDVTQCMFSSGNTTERQRMGRLHCAGETILDLYAGIGYYTLPFLCKAGAASVIACEWNPHALLALRHNLELNGVADRCQVLEGDCRQTAPKGVADRVSLGLLPSSQGGWQTALEALKPDLGGWLHLHHNVTDAAETEWCQQTMARLQLLADQVLGRSWICRVDHCERVKWYAPHVRHLVLDIHVQPCH